MRCRNVKFLKSALIALGLVSCAGPAPEIAPIPYTLGKEQEFVEAIPYVEFTQFNCLATELDYQCRLDMPERVQRWAEDEQAKSVMKLAQSMNIPFTTKVTGAPWISFQSQLKLNDAGACISETEAILVVSSHDVTPVHIEVGVSEEFNVSYADDALGVYMRYVSQSTIRSALQMFSYLKAGRAATKR